MSEVSRTIIGIVSLIVAVAIVSVLVSRNAQTPAVIQAAASGLANNLGVAESPVTGATYQIDTSYPNSHFGVYQ